MFWNYRVVRKVDTESAAAGGAVSFTLAEVFYEDDGTPFGWADADAFGESVDDLRANLAMMAEAFDAPVLDEADIPAETRTTWEDAQAKGVTMTLDELLASLDEVEP